MNSSANNIILEAKDISKYFGTITALKSANLSLKSGEVLGVVGENVSYCSSILL